MEPIIIALSLIGLALSFYVLHVEQHSGMKKNYKPVCDINNKISCTKAFKSEYGKTFGISNGFYGLIFYLIIIFLAMLEELQYIMILGILSIIGSIYLGYLQFIKLKTFCIICSFIYLVNILLVITSYIKLF